MYTLTPTFFEAVFLSTSGLQEEASWIDWEIMKEGKESGDRCRGTLLTETDNTDLGESLTHKARLDTKSIKIWTCSCVRMLCLNQYLLIILIASDKLSLVLGNLFKFEDFETRKEPKGIKNSITTLRFLWVSSLWKRIYCIHLGTLKFSNEKQTNDGLRRFSWPLQHVKEDVFAGLLTPSFFK